MENFIEWPVDIVLAILIFIISIICSSLLYKPLKLRLLTTFLLAVWHTLACLGAYLYALSFPADSKSYFVKSIIGEELGVVGSGLVIAFSSFFTSGMGVSFFGLFSIFNIFGVIALLILYSILRQQSEGSLKYCSRLYLPLLFLPGLSFWSSAPGKDSVALLAAALFTWSGIKFTSRQYTLLLSILLMGLVRPHVSVFMAFAYGITVLFDYRVPLSFRFIVLFGGFSCSVLIFDFIISYVRLDSLSIELVSENLKNIRSHSSTGGGSINTASISIFASMFFYLFGPLPGQVNNVFGLIGGLENIYILLLVILFICSKNAFSSAKKYPVLTIYFLTAWPVLSYVTYNYGIAIRQKWMILPALFAIVFYALSKQNEPIKR